MKIVLKTIVCALLFSCGKGADGKRFENIAARANPVIKKLQPSVAVVLDPNTSDVKALRAACRQGVVDAAPLATAQFNDHMREAEQMGVDDVMYTMSQQLELMCREDTGDGTRDARCKAWCVTTFGQLSSALERTRQEAAKENVQIEPLLKK